MTKHKRFKRWLAENFNYLSIGHRSDNFNSYVFPRRSDDITVSKLSDEFFHDDKIGRMAPDYKGRIDHDTKMISIVPETSDDKERLNQLVKILKSDYADYAIYFFNPSAKKLA